MKKTIICSIPMKEKVEAVRYISDDASLPSGDHLVRFPIVSFLEKTIQPNDELNVILLVKNDGQKNSEQNRQFFLKELDEANSIPQAKISIKTIETNFSQEHSVHEKLMASIVENIENETHIFADTTYGSKDLPIVIFAALNFAEKYLGCFVENIIYGQASFVNGNVVNPKLCDMVSLYCLSSVTNTIRCDDPAKARKMLTNLLSL